MIVRLKDIGKIEL